jgi:REP element-mobilizing transposase RayT
MGYDPILRARRSIRLADYDYSQAGAYYVTICSHQRRCLFGVVKDGRVRLSRIGNIVAGEWLRSCEVRPEVTLDAWVIMPNHVHGIIIVGAHGNAPPPLGLRWPNAQNGGPSLPDGNPNGGAHCHAPLHRQARSVASFVGGFKGAVTRRANALRGTPGVPVWQRGYYERVIRDEVDLYDRRLYIAQNPSQWETDAENPRHRTVMDERPPRGGQT